MPLWLVAVRLGIAEGSEGYPVGRREVVSRGDVRRREEAQAKKSGRSGRGKPEQWKPRSTDPGVLRMGDGAR